MDRFFIVMIGQFDVLLAEPEGGRLPVTIYFNDPDGGVAGEIFAILIQLNTRDAGLIAFVGAMGIRAMLTGRG